MQPSASKRWASIPGKLFLLGEYAALAGKPALVAAVGPRFELYSVSDCPEQFGPTRFSPESPTGKLLAHVAPSLVESFYFADPHRGRGGFGGSTAEFGLVYAALLQQGLLKAAAKSPWPDDSWLSLWRLYRELTASENQATLPPSGADLVAQWCGGLCYFDAEHERVQSLLDLPGSGVAVQALRQCGLVFSATGIAGRKVATHEHLADLRTLPQTLRSGVGAELASRVESAFAALTQGAQSEFGRSLSGYAQALHALGLESRQAHEDRTALSALPGVWGVKGCGALLSDVLVVWMEPEPALRAAVVARAQERGLEWLPQGLQVERGIEYPQKESVKKEICG